MTPLIEAIELEKSFGEVAAVSALSFSVSAGMTVGFVGPNGAGKTTTFRMLAGSLGPTRGRVRIAGYDLGERPFEAKRLIGYMPEAPPLYPEMTAREYLNYRADLRGVPRASRKKTVESSAERTQIQGALGTPIRELSKGFRQRVALSDALLGEPPVLLLDEPTAGLDPNQVLEFRALLRELGRERAVLLSTHVLSEVEAVCETALVIHHGRLVAQGRLAELALGASSSTALLVVRARPDVVRQLLGIRGLELREVRIEDSNLSHVVVGFAEGTHATGAQELIERAISALMAENVGVLEATPLRAALDDVFRALTRETGSTK